MPYQAPGIRKNNAKATKAVSHGDPVVELGFPGIAFKSSQLNAFVDPSTTAARQINIGEDFVIELGGIVEVADAKIVGGIAAVNDGTPVWIRGSDNMIEPSASAAEGADEVQTVTVSGSPTGGTYTLTFDGETTDPIAFNADAAAIQSALENLDSVEPGDVAVTGTGPFTVTFGGEYADVNVAQMTADGSGLTGGSSPAVAVATTTSGAGGTYKFGRVESVDTGRGVARVNTNLRDTF